MTDEEMLILREQGMAYEEIARQSGRTPAAVNARVKRAKYYKEQQARNIFDDQFNRIFCSKWTS